MCREIVLSRVALAQACQNGGGDAPARYDRLAAEYLGQQRLFLTRNTNVTGRDKPWLMKVQGMALRHHKSLYHTYLMTELFTAFPALHGGRVTKASEYTAAIAKADTSANLENSTKRNAAESVSQQKAAAAEGSHAEQGQLAKKIPKKKVGGIAY